MRAQRDICVPKVRIAAPQNRNHVARRRRSLRECDRSVHRLARRPGGDLGERNPEEDFRGAIGRENHERRVGLIGAAHEDVRRGPGGAAHLRRRETRAARSHDRRCAAHRSVERRSRKPASSACEHHDLAAQLIRCRKARGVAVRPAVDHRRAVKRARKPAKLLRDEVRAGRQRHAVDDDTAPRWIEGAIHQRHVLKERPAVARGLEAESAQLSRDVRRPRVPVSRPIIESSERT